MRGAVVGVLCLLLTACGGGADPSATDGPSPSSRTPSATAPSATPPTPSPSPSPSPTRASPPPGSRPPAWLGTRVLPTTAGGFGEVRPTPWALRNRGFTLPDTVAPLPGDGFAAKVSSPAPAKVIARSTWRAGCPVEASELAWIRLSFWGFDAQRHTGELLVHARVADQLIQVFRQLYEARFPIEEMRITRADELDAPPTGDGNNTSAFACRPVRGQRVFSQHAYGLAVDLNPFQNPYHKGDLVLPELASAYLDRDRRRPGVIVPSDSVTSAFDRIGWGWGGAWSSLKDYQHFSESGR